MNTDRICVVLNPRARHGCARKTWTRLLASHGSLALAPLIEVGPDPSWSNALEAAICVGKSDVIVVGGDGTVGSVVNSIWSVNRGELLSHVRLGAIAAGSSNDFHKPRGKVARGVGSKIDFDKSLPRDVAMANWTDPFGCQRERAFVVSASVGTVAEGNVLFNSMSGPMGLLKERAPLLAMAVAGASALARHRNIPVSMVTDGQAVLHHLSNLSVGKTRHVAGVLAYDSPVAVDDRFLDIRICENMSRAQLLCVVLGLAVGRFGSGPKKASSKAKQLELSSAVPFALELDGELFEATCVRFSLVPESLWVCP